MGALREDELIDVHTHVVPESFPRYLGRHADAPWPSMAPAHACHAHVMISGKVYRTVSRQCWSCSVRLADMDRQGVARQVLSPMPELLSYWMAPEDGVAMCRFLNETIAGMVAEAPARFAGLGAVPLQDVALAIEMLQDLRPRHGLVGVEIGGNVNGTPIGDARLRPFFEAAAALDLAVFVHALRPCGLERLVGPAIFEQVLAFPGEVGLAGASLITGGTLAAVPSLRVALSHGGGTLAALLPRLHHAWRKLGSVRDLLPADPAEEARRLYIDDLVYDAPTLAHLIEVFGSERVLAGSDYPFAIMDDDPAGSIDELAAVAVLDPELRTLLRGANARRWLGEADAVAGAVKGADVGTSKPEARG
ncbi:MAG: amidohydrolase [Burkholderiales bacterium]|nr:amidohydrolase [Burkholderiales bacterium]